MLPLLSPPGLLRRPSLRTLGAHRATRPELLTGVRAMDHASNESAPADAEPGEHVLAVVAAHFGRRCRPVVRLRFREAPDSRHPTSFPADPTPLWVGLSRCEAEDESERTLRAGPVLADERFSASAEEAAEDERDDYYVVELAGDRNEVRHQVEGEREVARERNDQRLLPARHARVTKQSAAENNAVRDEAGKGAGALASSRDDESED